MPMVLLMAVVLLGRSYNGCTGYRESVGVALANTPFLNCWLWPLSLGNTSQPLVRSFKRVSQIRIATRQSPLALWQARAVSDQLCAANPGLSCELVPMTTEGDRRLDQRLTEIGGKSVFIKELERALLDGRADIAVHSVKDVTAEMPAGMILAAFTEREDPRDAFVSNSYENLDGLPHGAVVGTGSSRRQCQLLAMRPDLEVKLVRGNVNTRLGKLDAGDYDALILAAAGLKRLEFHQRVKSYLEPEVMLPAVGQGVMGIECAEDNQLAQEVALAIDDPTTRTCVLAERAVNQRLGGGCHMPIAAYAEVNEMGQLNLRALAGSLDGTRVLRVQVSGEAAKPTELGEQVGQQLLDDGALDFLPTGS